MQPNSKTSYDNNISKNQTHQKKLCNYSSNQIILHISIKY